jgi:outer membrane protein OmpA-like peptidoglycan-associated protein
MREAAPRIRLTTHLILTAALALTVSACSAESSAPRGHSLCGIAAGLIGAGVGGGLGASIAVAAGGHGGASAGAIAGATAGGAAVGAAVGAFLAHSYCASDDPIATDVVVQPTGAAPADAPQYSSLASTAPRSPGLVLRGVHFAPGESAVHAGDDRILDDAAQVLAEHRELRIYVDGYTDSTEAPSQSLELAEKRARAVAEYLHARGVPARQLLPRGLGMTAYLASNATPEGRAQNRRVELVPAD